jgi:ubiquinone biosynthesis protein
MARRVAFALAAILPTLTVGAAVHAWPAGLQNRAAAAIALPTPLAHYEQFDTAASARALVSRIAGQLDPLTLGRIMAAMGSDPAATPPTLTTADAMGLLARVDLEPFRAELIEVLLHSSNVLDLIPEDSTAWVPLVHDSLLVVLNGMTMDRIKARVAGQAVLPASADRGERMLAFAAETPTFQKIGQILARSAWLPEDLRAPLQTLESDISTTGADAVIATIKEELGEETLAAYHVEFEGDVLSEASVGAVIGATIIAPGRTDPQRVVIKVIKAYAVDAINEDLESISALVAVLEAHRDFYGIGASPLVDMFREVRASLSREIQAEAERANLRHARAYFAGDPRVVVPWVCDCSSGNVTVMERIAGTKVTEAYPDDQEQRRTLARRLADITMYDVLFAPEDALFHGDPHAGNVFFVGDADDRYRIALIDWGLQGDLDAVQRAKLVQVGLGLRLKHADRLRHNVDGLITGTVNLERDGDTVDALIATLFADADAIKRETGKPAGTLRLLDRLASALARAGYSVDGDILLYVKATYTIEAVISDLDPEFDSGDYLTGRMNRQVLKEMPKRLANTLWVPGMWSHQYRSLLSNNDVWASILNSVGLAFKSIGVGVWKAISFPFR